MEERTVDAASSWPSGSLLSTQVRASVGSSASGKLCSIVGVHAPARGT